MRERTIQNLSHKRVLRPFPIALAEFNRARSPVFPATSPLSLSVNSNVRSKKTTMKTLHLHEMHELAGAGESDDLIDSSPFDSVEAQFAQNLQDFLDAMAHQAEEDFLRSLLAGNAQ